MRIVGGKWKGKRLTPPKGLSARPTTDFAKEALFNILTNRIELEGISVLDLFSGLGGMSLEFASRGASQVLSVELQFKNGQFLKQTAKSWNDSVIQVKRADVFQILKKSFATYDLIFVDPPYDHARIKELPELILSNGWLKDDGLLIIEHPKQVDFSEHSNFDEHRQYSAVNFSFFTL
jgi:16S rRNA (guanine(966)-N(2))-methyltransferase RsmD